MKRITKSLFTFALLMLGVTSANASYQIQLGTKFTSVDDLSGKVFAIVDESAEKAFYGPTGGYGHEIDFGAYSTAFSNDVNYYYFKLVDIPAATVEADPTLEGYTFIRACKADGSLYTFWGSDGNGYLNTQPNAGGVCFLLGITEKNLGQDADFGAVWKVEYVEGQGFTIKSKCSEDKYLKDAGSPYNEDPTYFTFCEVESVEVYDPDTEDPGVAAIPDGYETLISNGKFDDEDMSSFVTKDASGSTGASVIVDGAGRLEGNGLKITSKAGASQAWDTQFWVKFNRELKTGDKLHIEFDYRSSEPAYVSSQEHSINCGYVYWAGLNGFNPSLNWKHFSQDFTVSSGDNNADITIGSFAFNLNENKTDAIDFYFDNFLVYAEKPVAITDWTELVIPAESFVAKEQGVNGDPWLISNQDGEVTVMSADGASVDWDSQFFIKLSKKLPSGTKYKFTIDYKADQEAEVYTQSHNEPGAYKGNGNYGSFTCGTEYATHTKGTDEAPGSISEDGIWTIAFNLCKNKKETTFNFKNISFMIPTDVYETLDDSPAATAKPEPSITIASEYATFVPAYSMDITGNTDLVAYNVSYNAEKNSVTLEETAEMPIGQAILLYAEDGANTFSDGIEIKRVVGAETGLKAAAGGDNPTKGDGSTIYVLAEGAKGWGFYLLAADVAIPAGKGYLVIEAAEGREFIGFADDATTVKAIENLKKSGIIYNLAGQQVKSAKKGLYIIDGKKVMK